MEEEPITRTVGSACVRQIYGEGWLALGDAAMSFDPLSSQGLVSAMHGGEGWLLKALSVDDSPVMRPRLRFKRSKAHKF